MAKSSRLRRWLHLSRSLKRKKRGVEVAHTKYRLHHQSSYHAPRDLAEPSLIGAMNGLN